MSFIFLVEAWTRAAQTPEPHQTGQGRHHASNVTRGTPGSADFPGSLASASRSSANRRAARIDANPDRLP